MPTRTQRQVYATGRKKGAKRSEQIAAQMTSIVEAGGKNPNYGDRDSVGWRQERSHYGSVAERRNVRRSAGRYFDEIKSTRGSKQTPGQKAQAVQRSAFPDRYDAVRAEAVRNLRSLSGSVGDSPRRRPRGRRVQTDPGSGSSTGFDFAGLARSRAGTPVKGRLKNSLASAYLREKADPDSAYKTYTAGTPAKYKTVGGKKKAADGKAVAPGGVVKKDGWKGTKSVIYAGAKGMPSSSEKRGTVSTASGNVSDHYEGNKSAYARDVPASGPDGERKARKIAKRLGIKGYKTGNFDSYNITVDGRKFRVQILWDVADHTDHVHVGAKRL